MRSIRLANNLRGKVVLLRSDLNVESVKETFKLDKAIPTIAMLKKKGAITVILSHRGRPMGVDSKQSLRPLMPYLSRKIGKIAFISKQTKQALALALKNAQPGSVFLFENIRFQKGEDACDPAWANLLASQADAYVNDAFPSHHEGATVSLLPKLLPSYVGLQMEAEVVSLSKVMKNPKKPLVVILAGGKAADKFSVITFLHNKASRFLIGGILANTFFKAKGMDIGPSLIDKDILPGVKKMIGDSKLVLPMDWMADTKGKILDLGSLSAQAFSDVIAKAGTIIWNGPVGFFEDPRFRVSSVAIAKAVAKSKAYTVVGGGETTSLILDLKLQHKIDFLSTGGGAMLAFLASKPHAGLKALNYKR
jgi:phosphoglycerate kinase